MSNLKNKNRKVGVGVAKLVGYVITINSQSIRVLEEDASGKILKATGTAAATTQDSQSVYAKGAQYIKTDAGAGVKATYENVGTSASSTFNLMGEAAPGDVPLANTHILVGNASGVAADVAMSGDATISNTGVLTIAAGAVTNSKVADSNGTSALGIRKSATVVYDFAVHGGVAGTIALTGAPTLPDNAVVWVESYDVLTTCTSATDAATIKLQLPTDGDLTTAIAISDGSNPWDIGVFSRIAGGLATPLTKKTTAARVPSLAVAGGENLTAGKIVFQLAYWVSA